MTDLAPMTDDELREAVALISVERLAAFVAITGTERDALALHHQTMQLAAALMPVVGLLEVALRNAVCDRLRQTFGVPDWLTNPPPPFQWKGDEDQSLSLAKRHAQRAAYAKKSQADKKALDALAFPNGVPPDTSHERRSKARQKVIPITTGQLVAQLTLFFWKRLFSEDYAATLWDRGLKRLFPNKTLSRSQIARHLEALYQARNRMAHHEPIYGARLTQTLAAVDFLAMNYGALEPTPAAILCKIIAPYRASLAHEAQALTTMLARFTVP